ncbi:MAG: hypothetical protein ACM3P0_03840 [Acidobacteriota bacterium]
MGLLPIIGKAIGLFSFLSVTALTISFILYKLRSPRNKPYTGKSGNPYPAQQSYMPAFQSSYYQAQEMVSVPRQMEPVSEMIDIPERPFAAERRNLQERTEYTGRGAGERNASERRPVQQKVNARPRSKFQILHSTEDGEIKAYHLPMRDY